jgi:hypothetical protein
MEHKAGHAWPRRVVSSRARLLLALVACLSLPVAASCGAQPPPGAVTPSPSGAPTAVSAIAPATAASTAGGASDSTPRIQPAPQSSSNGTPQPTAEPGTGQTPRADTAPQPTASPLGPTAGAQPQNNTPVTGKGALTPAQEKIDSNLLAAIKQSRGEAGDQPQQNGVQVDADGRTVVDITAFVTPALIDRLNELGAEVLFSSTRFRSIRARIALNQVETIAAQPDVVFIQPKQEGTTQLSV